MRIDKHSVKRLKFDKQEFVNLLNQHGLSTYGVTPYGLLQRINGVLSKDDVNTILWNSYYTNSLLHNGNKWLDVAWLMDVVPFDLKSNNEPTNVGS